MQRNSFVFQMSFPLILAWNILAHHNWCCQLTILVRLKSNEIRFVYSLNGFSLHYNNTTHLNAKYQSYSSSSLNQSALHRFVSSERIICFIWFSKRRRTDEQTRPKDHNQKRKKNFFFSSTFDVIVTGNKRSCLGSSTLFSMPSMINCYRIKGERSVFIKKMNEQIKKFSSNDVERFCVFFSE